MARPILSEEHIDPAIREVVDQRYRETVDEVRRTVETTPVVVVGMKHNPHVRRARKALEAAGVAHTYLEYGSYTGEWRRRSAIKMWSGWHTFPHVFVKGVLIGGANETVKLLADGELQRRLA